MKDDLNYRVSPLEPNCTTITLSTEERKRLKGLGWGLAALLFIIFAFGFYHLLVPIYRSFRIPRDRILESPTIVILLISAAVITAVISYLIKKTRIITLERKRTKETNREASQRVVRDAEYLTTSLKRTYDSSIECAAKLSNCLTEASLWLRTAENEYQANAFASYWDAVEQAAIWLGDYNHNANQLAQNAKEYYGKLSGQQHTFPAFPVSLATIPDASFITSELRRVTRLGQTNFQFANIWEHRRTRRAIVAGFRTLNDAINDLGDTIESSVSSLKDSMSSDTAQLVEEQIRTRESVEKTPVLLEQARQTVDERGSKIDKRLLEQNRMLDNIQHQRQPKLKDIPSKR